MLTTPSLTRSVIALGALFSLATIPLTAQTATSTTPPVGYVRTELLGQSDTFTATSLTRSPVYVGTVETATGNTITVTGSPNWDPIDLTYAPNEQPNTYYVRVGAAPEGENNPFEGRDFKVETSGGSTLIVTDPLNGDLLDLPVGTKVEVLPYWTLKTLFPAEDAGISFEATPNLANIKTEILFPDLERLGINLAPTRTYFFMNGAWRKGGESVSKDYGDEIIEPQRPLRIRSNTSILKTLTLSGTVSLCVQSAIIKANNGLKQDNILTTGKPVPVSLNDLDLIESNVFDVSPSMANITDELLLYSNDVAAKNKSATATYFYFRNGWRKGGQSVNTDFGDDVIPSDAAFIIRKASSTEQKTLIWKSSEISL